MKHEKIDAFARKYRRVARNLAANPDASFLGRLEVNEFTAHPEVNRLLTVAFRDAVEGNVSHFDAVVQDARNEMTKLKESALAKMRSRV